MPTNKPQLKTYVTEEQAYKFKIIAEQQGRTTSNLLGYLVKQTIEDFEQSNGTINIKNNVTISNNSNGNININQGNNNGNIHINQK